jgi:hypothetical protein
MLDVFSDDDVRQNTKPIVEENLKIFGSSTHQGKLPNKPQMGCSPLSLIARFTIHTASGHNLSFHTPFVTMRY